MGHTYTKNKQEKDNYEKYATAHGMKTEWLGNDFSIGFTMYRLEGWIKGSKRPVLVEDIEDGSYYQMPVNEVKELFLEKEFLFPSLYKRKRNNA